MGGMRRLSNLPVIRTPTRTVDVCDLTTCGCPFLPRVTHFDFRRLDTHECEHVHRGIIEVIFCLCGSDILLSVAGKPVPFRTGNVFISRPNEPHTIKTHSRGLDYCCFHYRIPRRGEALPGLTVRETEDITRALRKTPRIFAGSAPLKRAFLRVFELYAEREHPKPTFAVRMRLAALDLLCSTVSASVTSPAETGRSDIDDLVAEIAAHPEREFLLDDMAARCRLSAVTLTNRFVAQTGVTPHAYHIKCRIEKAKEMLAGGKLPVAAVAKALGFASPRHFATQFKVHTDRSPSDWSL